MKLFTTATTNRTFMSFELYSQSIKTFFLFITALLLMVPGLSRASIVTMETTLGDIKIELFDADAPVTVQNFLNYVNDGDYANSFFHRSVSGFIVQSGGFQFDGSQFNDVPADPSITNEFQHSNLRGTIAMAKLGGDPDSATNQWFFNLADNSANLDSQNGGFTVFGQVIEGGMSVVDAIAALPTFNLTNISTAFSDVPLSNFSGTLDPNEHLVRINNVTTVPIPAALYLFASGLLGIMGFFRKYGINADI